MTLVYTAILGGCDSLKPAPEGADRAVCFVDDAAAYHDALGWTLVPYHVSATADPRREAWHLRAVPHRLFFDYTRVVWIDASFTLTDMPKLMRDTGKAPVAALRHHARSSCYTEANEIVRVGQARAEDIEPQMAAYRRAGFIPKHLSISCIVVRDRSEQAVAFSETWDEQTAKHVGDNTQLSLDYSAWAHNLEIAPLRGTRHENPYSVHDHRDHKKRRKPYRIPMVDVT